LIDNVHIVLASSQQDVERAQDHPDVGTESSEPSPDLGWHDMTVHFDSKRAIPRLREAMTRIVVGSVNLDPVALVLQGQGQVDDELLSTPDTQVGMDESDSSH
jgi:hypothetical protein